MSDISLNGLKNWFTDDENVFERIAQQRRDETASEAVPIMIGVFLVGAALGTMGAMFVADRSGAQLREDIQDKAQRIKAKGQEALD